MRLAGAAGAAMNDIEAIVTDIEGTTSSIDFVHDVLFPYAASLLPEFVRTHESDPEVAKLLDDVRKEAGEPDAAPARIAQILLQWIADDRKSTALKALQGLVWEAGYENGDFTGHVYEDTAPNLRRWAARGIALYVYSSGSVKAQQLLFGHSDAGDLRPLFTGYFDTRVGPKRDVASYRSITAQIGLPAGRILFLSDVVQELDAAAAAGMRTVRLVRHGSSAGTGRHRQAHDFNQVLV
jgi:enolase-phosphatase E1